MKNLVKRVLAIVGVLKELYPDALCTLDYGKDYELLFSTRLAAQCTDERVNRVTEGLFRDYPTLESFASADYDELALAVRPCGLGNTKARDIIACANALIERFGGVVPGTMEELLSLPGVGRKTANIIIGDVYHKAAVVTDTHCIRLANRMGLCETKNPYKVERALAAIIPPEEQSNFCHRLVLHGRALCMARGPMCSTCPVAPHCDYAAINRQE